MSVTLRCFFAGLLLLQQGYVFAGPSEYAVSNIDKALLAKANAVVRLNEMHVEIKELDKVVTTYHYVITVLNARAENLSFIAEEYNKMVQLEEIYGNVYDGAGKLVKKIRGSDFIIHSDPSRGVYDDNKMKVYDVANKTYPYTIEYFVKQKQNFTFMLPDWAPQPTTEAAIEQATFTLEAPVDIEMKYKVYNITNAPQTAVNGAKKSYTWQLKNIAAFKQESMCFRGEPGTPVVMFAAQKFSLGGHMGSMKTWNDYGKFVYELNKGRDELPPAAKAKVQELTKGLDTKKKIEALYSYLQSNMRYVAVEYNIGGWQTLDAAFTFQNKYGDCKSLSNYMYAMLKEAGIRSFVTIIKADADNQFTFQKDFPNQQFNHVILCVPMQKDSIWLECTSSDLPAGYLSDFTHDREAILITPDGGKVVRTPVYTSGTNKTTRYAKAVCNDDGSIAANITCAYAGRTGVSMQRQVINNTDNDVAQFVDRQLDLSSYTVKKFNFQKQDVDKNVVMKQTLDINANGMISKSGTRYFISVDLMPVKLNYPIQTDERRSPFYLSHSMATNDTFEIQMPPKTLVESIPETVNEHFPFGDLYVSVVKKDDKLIFIRRIEQKAGIYKAQLYKDFEHWVDEVNSTGDKKVVLKYQ